MGATQCSGCSCNKKVDQQPRCPSRQDAENQWTLVVADGSGPSGTHSGDLNKLPQIYEASYGDHRSGGDITKPFAVHVADPLATAVGQTARSEYSDDLKAGFIVATAGESLERRDAAGRVIAPTLASAKEASYTSNSVPGKAEERTPLLDCDQLAPTVLQNGTGHAPQANGFKTEPQQNGGCVIGATLPKEENPSEAGVPITPLFSQEASARCAQTAGDTKTAEASPVAGTTCRSADGGTRSGGTASMSTGRRLSRAMSRSSMKVQQPTKALTKRLSRMFSHAEVNSSGLKRLPASGNANLPADYSWLESAIRSVGSNEAHTLGCTEVSSGSPFTPLFFVFGACPSMVVGMQIVMFALSAKSEVDFWWVKPKKSAANELETETLSLHSKGTHKNDPGRSRPVYKPLADLFEQGQCYGGRTFGIEKATSSRASARAYIDQPRQDGSMERVYLTYIWIEDWTTNPFARSKYIKGKLVYQRREDSLRFHSRQYCIVSGSVPDVTIWDNEDPGFDTILPDDKLKLLWE